MVELLGKQVDTTISKEVKKATAHLKGSNLEDEAVDSGGPASKHHGSSNIDHKFEKLETQLHDKSNKQEAEMALRQISILHKMLRQTVILITQKFKSSIQSKTGMTANQLANKKVHFLNQSLIISKWISNLDTDSVNDCFDEKQNRVPILLVEYDDLVNEEIKNIASMKLSPNNQPINESIKGHSSLLMDQIRGAKLVKKKSTSPQYAVVSRNNKSRSALTQSVDGPIQRTPFLDATLSRNPSSKFNLLSPTNLKNKLKSKRKIGLFSPTGTNDAESTSMLGGMKSNQVTNRTIEHTNTPPRM